MKDIVIIDDHPLFREGIKMALSSTPGYTVLYEAKSIESMSSFIDTSQQDFSNVLFIIDVSLPDGSGFELIPLLESAGAQRNHCAMISIHDDYEYAEHAFSQGAFAYISKIDEPKHILDCLKALERGQRYLSPSVKWHGNDDAFGVLGASQSTDEDLLTGEDKVDYSVLSKRELAVLKLVAQGKTSREIADLMFLSQRTIENHRSRICSKLGVSGAHGLIARAVKDKDRIELLN